MTKVYTLEIALSVLELLKFFLNFIKILVTVIIILLTIGNILISLLCHFFIEKTTLIEIKRHR